MAAQPPSVVKKLALMAMSRGNGARQKVMSQMATTSRQKPRETIKTKYREEDDGEYIESSQGQKQLMNEHDVHRLCSGFLDKPRSLVLIKHMWPHMNQNPRYVTNSLSFNQLNFCQFVGGECRTILKTDNEEELIGRLRILSKIAYMYNQCQDWEKARNAYFAILSSIEEGESYWTSSFGHYDIMCPPRSEDGQKGEGKALVKIKTKKDFFCREYQKAECQLNAPHRSWIKNSYENVEHYCAVCYKLKLGKLSHVPHSEGCSARK